MVESVISATKRIPHEISRATPATIDHIRLLQKLTIQKPTLTIKWTFVLAAALFFSCSGVKDLIKVKRGAADFKQALVEIMAGKLKIDQYRRNADMKYLARLTNKELCPYRILADWMAEKACRKDTDMPLFLST